MTELLTLVVTGLVSGAVYSLIASSLTLTYQTTGIFNLGYGAIAFTGAFTYYLLHVGLGWPIAPAAVCALALTGPVTGAALDRLIFRRLTDASDASKIMASIGVLVFLPALAYLAEQLANQLGAHLPNTTEAASAPGIGPSPVVTWHLGAIPLNSDQLVVLGVATIVAVAMSVLLQRTPLGLRMRALVDRPGLAELRGVDRPRTSMLAWVIGCSLASLTGIVAAPVFQSLQPGTFTTIMFVSVAAAVVGGLRSVPIAFASGLALGIVESLTARYATFASRIQGFDAAVPFVVLLAGLLVWGRVRVRVAGVTVGAGPATEAGDDPPSLRTVAPWALAAVALVAYVTFVADSYWVAQTAEGLGLAIVFLSFTVTTGLGGLVSLAQAALAMVSALTAGLLLTHYHAPYPVAVLGGTLVAASLATVVAVPALRLGGLALALATLALGFLGDNVLFQWRWLSNGNSGWAFVPPRYGPLDLADSKTLALVFAALLVLLIVAVRNVRGSAAGRAATAVTESEAAARMSGISPGTVKLFVVVVGAGIAGLGGAMLFTYSTAVTSTTYPTSVGLVWLAGVVLWGVRRPASAVLAGLSVAWVPALLSGGLHFGVLTWHGTSNPYLADLLFGLGAIQMSRDPNGLLSFNAALLRRARARRAQTGTAAPSPGRPVTGQTPSIPVAPTDAVALSVEHVSAGYGHREILRDVSLALAPASITALIGLNGAGKSTLCGVIGGSVVPSQGILTLHGREVGRLSAHQRCARGLLVAPESRGVFPGLSVDDNLRVLLPAAGDRAAVYDAFPLLAARRSRPAGSLSGGEQQVLTMAPLFVHPPQVLVADEPTLGLAPTVAREVLRLCTSLREQGTALLLIEERANAVLDLADQVAVLQLGQIVWSGPPGALPRDELHASYLGAAPPAGTIRAPR